jgi:hypothetical protein
MLPTTSIQLATLIWHVLKPAVQSCALLVQHVLPTACVGLEAAGRKQEARRMAHYALKG